MPNRNFEVKISWPSIPCHFAKSAVSSINDAFNKNIKHIQKTKNTKEPTQKNPNKKRPPVFVAHHKALQPVSAAENAFRKAFSDVNVSLSHFLSRSIWPLKKTTWRAWWNYATDVFFPGRKMRQCWFLSAKVEDETAGNHWVLGLLRHQVLTAYVSSSSMISEQNLGTFWGDDFPPKISLLYN